MNRQDKQTTSQPLRTVVRETLEQIETIEGEQLTLKQHAVRAMIRAAIGGDTRAFEMVMRLAGDYDDKPDTSNGWGNDANWNVQQ